MLFNSLTFVVFFALVYALYWLLAPRAQNRMLLAASYLFYGWWDWRFLGLILISTVVDYVAANSIASSDSSRTRHRFLLLSIGTNLGILGLFKYANFFVDNLAIGLDAFGVTLDARITSIVLPVGISFYTFQTLSYTIDVYRGKLKPTRNFLDFALFVCYFPQLVAGPIERASVLLPQLTQARKIQRIQIEQGCWLILSGYYLKCVLADNLSPFVQRVFDTPQQVAGLEIIVGIYAAAFQIYGDFAGYSRIARGISKLMGIDLQNNFNRPYLASSPSDFWSRWHISLSTWLRDYLYIPLGGNRRGRWIMYRNLMITMLLGGLWHGASWNFVAWGAFHGLLLCAYRRFGKRHQPATPQAWYQFIPGVLVFFQLTCIGWLLFFVKNLGDVPILVNNCVTDWQWNGRIGLITIALFAVPVLLLELTGECARRPSAVLSLAKPLRLAAYGAVTMAIFVFGAVDHQEFIYFAF